MKRSYMVKFMQDEWKKHVYNVASVEESGTYKACDNLLKQMEKAGMFPPGYMKPIPFESDGKQYPLVPGDFKNNDNIWCTPGIQEWEEE